MLPAMPARLTACLLLLLALGLAAPAARAQDGPWSEGTLEYTLAYSCTSIILGNPQLVFTTGAGAAFEGSTQRIPPAGEVFYSRLLVAIVGDPCGGGGSVLPEFVPPAGVEPAVSRRHPVLWRYVESESTPDQRGSTILSRGPNGGLLVGADAAGSENDGPWPLANSGPTLEIKVPLRSSRRLNGIGSRAPNCPARDNGSGPCPRGESGDHLQIAVQVADGGSPGTLVPIIGLFNGPPAAPSLRAPARAGRRFTAKVTTAPRASATGVLKAGGRVLARARARANGQGVARLRFSLPAGLAGRAVLSVRAKTVDEAISPPATRRLRLQP
jgi:hypothetical protein